VPEETIRKILVDNPKRFLAFVSANESGASSRRPMREARRLRR